MKLICAYCKQSFERKRSKKAKRYFCCVEHHHLWQKTQSDLYNCKFCGKPTKNKKYCSQSCSAKAHNSPQGICSLCGTSIPKANKYCEDCRSEGMRLSTLKRSDWIYTTTIRDILQRNNGQRANNYRQIRDHARQVYSQNNPKCCKICGYELHYDVCHIKSIKDFDLDTTIDIVNAPENLIGLCKNHHWELDNGYLNLNT